MSKVYHYKINTPFGKSIPRTEKTLNNILLRLKNDVITMFTTIGTINVDIIEHKIDWYNNEYDYQLSQCYTLCERSDQVNLLLDGDIDYYVALFRMLNVPLGYATDPKPFKIIF